MTLPPSVIAGYWMALSAMQLWGMRVDKKKKLACTSKSLRRDLYFNIGLMVVCIVTGIFSGFFSPKKNYGDWSFIPYVFLAGIRASIQARRERQAWKDAVVLEIMES